MKTIIPVTKLKERRVMMKKPISQAQIAKKIGVATSLYGGIERGQLNCDGERATKIAKLLDTPKKSLFMAVKDRKDTFKALV